MDNKTKQEYFVVKYALTDGITKVQGIVKDQMLIADTDRGVISKDYYHGRNKQWCDNVDDAIRVAEEMRAKRITSLKKQITKYENLKFGG